jgi:hypothetical protein
MYQLILWYNWLMRDATPDRDAVLIPEVMLQSPLALLVWSLLPMVIWI